MATRKKTVADECTALLRRHDTLSNLRKSHLGVYIGSLTERFASIDYALQQIRRRFASTTDDVRPFQTPAQERDFYVNCFWSFSYSVFDILAHVVNTVHRRIAAERDVSFLRSKSAFPPPIRNRMDRISRRWYFIRLRSFRQCCLHRRTVCVQDTTTTKSISMPYVGSTATTGTLTVAFLCDSTEDMKPKFNAKRNLLKECETMRTEIENDVRSVLQKV